MVAALLAVIGVATEARVSGTAEARARAIRKALTFIKDRPGEAIGLNRLCEVCRVSERTLQRAFLDHFGVTPKTYLLAFRLNQVRRELLSPGVPGLLIRDIAIGMGFWHMSQFARDYKRLFGELPSQTLANSRRESSSAEKDEPITATDTQADERG